MAAIHYCGWYPEIVKKSWLSVVNSTIQFKSVTEKNGIWVFELDIDAAKVGLSMLQMIDFIDSLGEEIEYVHFYFY